MAIVYYYSIQQTSLLLVYYYYQCTIIVYYYQCIITIIVYYYYLANIITITHMIHVWYICLHWGYIDGIHVTIQQHHGSYGVYIVVRENCHVHPFASPNVLEKRFMVVVPRKNHLNPPGMSQFQLKELAWLRVQIQLQNYSR